MKKLNFNKELIERCKKRDSSAQYALYNSYSAAMYNTCLRMLNNEMDAQDVLQNSFVDVFRNIDSFSYQATPGAWIKRIVINNCINHLKKRRLQLVEFEAKHEMIDDAADPCHGDLSVHKVKSAISQLSDGYRTIFTMYTMEGYDHGEIATCLGITESTSKSQYHRAKQKIKQIIQES